MTVMRVVAYFAENLFSVPLQSCGGCILKGVFVKKYLLCVTLVTALHGGLASAADLSFDGEGGSRSRACSDAATVAAKYGRKVMLDMGLIRDGYRLASWDSLKDRCKCEKDADESPPWSCEIEIDHDALVIPPGSR